ncbi:hypothetical protein [Nocardioides sp.]|uniref:hypothetical protein n=1 Tax=Nocardioides sp. TaxID=35761 RepID=UPI003218FFDA
MEDFRVVPHDMSTAADETVDAASQARGRDSASHLTTAASAVPGAQSVALLGELGDGWRDEIDAWAGDVAGFADAVDGTGRAASARDGAIGGYFGTFLDLVGAGR